MKKRMLALVSAFLLSANVLSAHEGKAKKEPVKVGPTPEILSKYYPPASIKMELVEVMHGLSGSFKGAWIDAKQGQWENALKNAEALEVNYKKAFDMTGEEWQKKYFKLETARKFREAVAAKDMKAMGTEGKELGESCGNCHREQYVSVWLKYYWSDFDAVKLEDPITEKSLGFEDYKHGIMDSFYGLTNDGKQGDTANAVKSGKEFVQRYRGLKASCMKCHEDEQVKYFYVGGKVEQAVADLSAALDKDPLDMKAVFGSIGVIGKEGCKKCHLTHRWAAILKGNQE